MNIRRSSAYNPDGIGDDDLISNEEFKLLQEELWIRELFEELAGNRETDSIELNKLREFFERCGLDWQRQEIKEKFHKWTESEDKTINWEAFSSMGGAGETGVIQKAVTGNLAIPDFQAFCEGLVEIFEEVRKDHRGHNATYIPELANVPPEKFGFAVCTVDGQQFSYGDSHEEFCIQSCSKPFMYCLVCEALGSKEVHRWVGREPSGVAFNAFSLTRDHKPHNPMINSGAILVCSTLMKNEKPSKRINYVINQLERYACGQKLGFSQPTYLSERESASHNFALAYFMKSCNAFPEDVDITNELEFYFQVCSITVNCQILATMASMLAKGGVCPFTGEVFLNKEIAKSCLQLMLSCGMYDFSGEWACTIGLPAKSGVSGSIFAVIPNVMGICIWSPRLDDRGNSHRGIQFFSKMTEKYSLSIFDQIWSGQKLKIDPTIPCHPRKKKDSKDKERTSADLSSES